MQTRMIELGVEEKQRTAYNNYATFLLISCLQGLWETDALGGSVNNSGNSIEHLAVCLRSSDRYSHQQTRLRGGASDECSLVGCPSASQPSRQRRPLLLLFCILCYLLCAYDTHHHRNSCLPKLELWRRQRSPRGAPPCTLRMLRSSHNWPRCSRCIGTSMNCEHYCQML